MIILIVNFIIVSWHNLKKKVSKNTVNLGFFRFTINSHHAPQLIIIWLSLNVENLFNMLNAILLFFHIFLLVFLYVIPLISLCYYGNGFSGDFSLFY